MTDREVIDQLGSTGTYVTRDGDGVLRHWNGITDEFVGSEPGPTSYRPTITGDGKR